MKKIVLFLAVLLVSVSACKNPFLKKMLVEEEKGESSAVPKHTVTFSVEGGHGTLKATVDSRKSIQAIQSNRVSLLSLRRNLQRAMCWNSGQTPVRL